MRAIRWNDRLRCLFDDLFETRGTLFPGDARGVVADQVDATSHAISLFS
jgi:hypothetical protein